MTDPTATPPDPKTPPAAADTPETAATPGATPRALPPPPVAPSRTSLALIAFFCGLLGGAAVMAITTLETRQPKRLAVVNMGDILERHILGIAKRNLTPEAKTAVSRKFSTALEAEVTKLIEEEGLILLEQRAVLSDETDYTGYIEQKLQQHDDL